MAVGDLFTLFDAVVVAADLVLDEVVDVVIQHRRRPFLPISESS